MPWGRCWCRQNSEAFYRCNLPHSHAKTVCVPRPSGVGLPCTGTKARGLLRLGVSWVRIPPVGFGLVFTMTVDPLYNERKELMEPITILLVGSSTVVMRGVRLALERSGYRVSVLAGGDEGGRTGPDARVPDLLLLGPEMGTARLKDGPTAISRSEGSVSYSVLSTNQQGGGLDLGMWREGSGGSVAPAQHVFEGGPWGVPRVGVRWRVDTPLRDRLQWLATMLRHVQDAVLTTDRDGVVTFMNPAAERLTGWSQSEAVGVGFEALLAPSSWNEEATPNPALLALAEGRSVGLQGLTFVGSDSVERSLDGTAAPVFQEAGHLLGAVIVLHAPGATQSLDCREAEPSPLADDVAGGLRARGMLNLCAWCKRLPDGQGRWCDLETYLAECAHVPINGGLCPECLARCFPRVHPHLTENRRSGGADREDCV